MSPKWPKRSQRDLFDLERELSKRPLKEKRPQGERINPYRAAGLATTIPIALAVGPVMGYFAGSFLDTRFHVGFWTPLMVLLGLAGSIRLTVNLIKELGR